LFLESVDGQSASNTAGSLVPVCYVSVCEPPAFITTSPSDSAFDGTLPRGAECGVVVAPPAGVNVTPVNAGTEPTIPYNQVVEFWTVDSERWSLELDGCGESDTYYQTHHSTGAGPWADSAWIRSYCLALWAGFRTVGLLYDIMIQPLLMNSSYGNRFIARLVLFIAFGWLPGLLIMPFESMRPLETCSSILMTRFSQIGSVLFMIGGTILNLELLVCALKVLQEKPKDAVSFAIAAFSKLWEEANKIKAARDAKLNAAQQANKSKEEIEAIKKEKACEEGFLRGLVLWPLFVLVYTSVLYAVEASEWGWSVLLGFKLDVAFVFAMPEFELSRQLSWWYLFATMLYLLDSPFSPLAHPWLLARALGGGKDAAKQPDAPGGTPVAAAGEQAAAAAK
jgi:hypothetical protein